MLDLVMTNASKTLLLLVAPLLAMSARADEPAMLGRIDFPVTAPAEARRHFERGVLAMHSFWYEEARDEFRAATATAPGFAMGYWGEALSFYNPVWGQEDLAATRAALAKIKSGMVTTPRERAFIDAARALTGNGDLDSRRIGYTDAMARVHRQFPSDDEAATLYAVALLGSSPRSGSFRPYAEAAAIALDVLARNPNHPGAAHYVIHAFDDPAHAILALPAARRYAKIAPEAFHARHMPSHIFVQLGMWKEAQDSNEAAWAASVGAAQKKKLDNSYEDFHSLSWLQWIAIERGQPKRARAALDRGLDALAHSLDPDRMPFLVGEMAAQQVVATDDWEHMEALLAPLATVEQSVLATKTKAAKGPSCAAHAQAKAAEVGLEARAVLVGMRGEAAAARKDRNGIAMALAALQEIIKKQKDDPDSRAEALMLDAHLAELDGKHEQAIASLRKAVAIEEREPPSGPGGAVTIREILGELLARLGRQREALVELTSSLDRHPGRSRSLLGAARAARAIGDARAHDYYARLAVNWTEAESDLPALAEVRREAAR
jgi:tetratricopeptide (TPR) repeat protein